MGRASRAKKERRQADVARAAERARARGGRPRLHVDDAARMRAYRLRKKQLAAGESAS